MRVKILKTFSLSGREFKKGEVWSIPEKAYTKLKLKGLVETLNNSEGLGAEPIQAELNRACVNCEGNKWLILKPDFKTSLIQCLSCGHVELYIKGAK